MPLYDDVLEVWREFTVFNSANPLPIGDPSSGQWNPSKSQIRDILIAMLQASGNPEALADILAELRGRKVVSTANSNFSSTTFPTGTMTVIHRQSGTLTIWLALTAAPSPTVAVIHQQDQTGQWWERVFAVGETTPSYVDRAAAVTQAERLPSSVTQLLNRNGNVLELRSRTASSDDPLYGTGSRWGVMHRFPDTGYLASLLQNYPIPMAAAQATLGGTVTLTPLVPILPSTSTGLTYEFKMPLGVPAGTNLVITQAPFTRTISGTTSIELLAGDRVIFRVTSNGAGVFENLIPSGARMLQLLGLSGGAAANAAAILALQQDMALHDTIRTPIPLTGTQTAADEPVVLVPVSALWPFNSNGYVYEFEMPTGKRAGINLVITMGTFTRTISGSQSLEIQAGDRIRVRPTSNGAGVLVGLVMSPARLIAMATAIASAPQVVQQRDGAMPARPNTTGPVFWVTWDDPGTRFQEGDIWFDLETPKPPAAPALTTFYMRPTLGSIATSLVVRGLPVERRIPTITGIQYNVDGGSPVVGPAESPQTFVLPIEELSPGQQMFAQLAMSNFAGLGAYSAVKQYTVTNAGEFTNSFITPATESLIGKPGFKNIQVLSAPPLLTTQGLTTDANRYMWTQTDVGGLEGTRIFGECDVFPTGSVSSDLARIVIGLNNVWRTDPNDVTPTLHPEGLMFLVIRNQWQIVRRLNNSDTVLQSGTITNPTKISAVRQGNDFRGSINNVQVVTYDLLSFPSPELLDPTQGVSIGLYRPSGGSTAHFRAQNFRAGTF